VPEDRRPLDTALALVALLPFLRGLLSGSAFYFRDLSLQFFPLRQFVAEGLRAGELRFWNPWAHEGVPLSLPPLAYPVDLLQVLGSSEWALSLLLALHVPLAALALARLAEDLGASRLAAATAGLVYALGGFSLATVSLYVYLQAMAWAPLAMLGLRRAALGGPRQVALAALAVGVLVSTTGAEIAAQALGAGLLLLPSARRDALGRALAGLALGAGLAALPVCLLAGILPGTARAAGFPSAVVLAHSVHPLTLPQVLVANWHGDLSDLANRFWGMNFFTRGFPYVTSLYLGPVALGLAGAGLLGNAHGVPRRRLALLAMLGLVAALGEFGGLGFLVDAVPALHAFRYPVKAFFSFHLAVALLCAGGIDAIGQGRKAVPALLLAFVALPLVLAPLLPLAWPARLSWFLSGFLPPDFTAQARAEVAAQVLGDAAVGGGIALVAALVAGLAAVSRLAAPRAGAALTALLALDLVRAGAGLNPMAPPGFFRLSPEMAEVAARLRATGERVYTLDLSGSPAYRAGRVARGRDHERWTFTLFRETLAPFYNVAERVPSAWSPDLTMLGASERVLPPEAVPPGRFRELVPALVRAGVGHVLSLDALRDERLTLEEVVATRQSAPLAVHVYRLRDPLPRFALAREVVPARTQTEADQLASAPGFLAAGGTAVEAGIPPGRGAQGSARLLQERSGSLLLDVEASAPTVAVVRDGWAPGWTATVDGETVPVWRADGRHRAVAVPGGRSRLEMRYRPPGLVPGLAISSLCGLLAASCWLTRRKPAG
jgi:hypothetical protein